MSRWAKTSRCFDRMLLGMLSQYMAWTVGMFMLEMLLKTVAVKARNPGAMTPLKTDFRYPCIFSP
ncbi:hypothetical protein D3C72_2368930 [compost metagenome]